jgi:hypothetical protein
MGIYMKYDYFPEKFSFHTIGGYLLCFARIWCGSFCWFKLTLGLGGAVL